MILETCQLLSTAHRVLDGKEYIGKSKSGRNVKRWKLDDSRETNIYSATHVNHPSAVWCRATNNNYNWLYCHLEGLINEYHYRYGKIHKCTAIKAHLSRLPKNIPIGNMTQPTPAMPEAYIVPGDSLLSYRAYYSVGKKHLHRWKNRSAPSWIA
jgi:hypothetical protein